MSNYLSSRDLAGEVCFKPNFFQSRARINLLIDRYLNLEKLCDRLEDLPKQWQNPQPRQWQNINWQNINSKQIIGLKLAVFLSIIVGAANTEAPIRGYTQTSRKYLAKIHPPMAKFVGGLVTESDTVIELGLWEKEERQHTPALIKIYRQLTGKNITPKLCPVKSYQPSDNPYADLYHHGVHRVATEYAAVCLYLWLMSHTTGEIQQVFQEILQDEINHMTKFWGFGLWLYSNSGLKQDQYSIDFVTNREKSGANLHKSNISRLISTFRCMMTVLNWDSWTSIHKIELIYTFICVFQRMQSWRNHLTITDLQQLFNSSDINSSQFCQNNIVDR